MAEELSGQAEELRSMVSRFHLSSGGAALGSAPRLTSMAQRSDTRRGAAGGAGVPPASLRVVPGLGQEKNPRGVAAKLDLGDDEGREAMRAF